jgi:predicted transcriptional regulator
MDTQKTVQELLSTGLTQKQLAVLVPCSQSLISALKNGERGSRLSFHVGQRLTYLHKKRCTPKVNIKE